MVRYEQESVNAYFPFNENTCHPSALSLRPFLAFCATFASYEAGNEIFEIVVVFFFAKLAQRVKSFP